MISKHLQYKMMYFLHKIPFCYSIVEKIYRSIFKKHLEAYRSRYFNKKALEVLSIFHECMETYNIEYTLAFGSLLGAIREKGFIKHDQDIDVMLWNDKTSEHVRDALLQFGFKLSHEFLIDNGMYGREETYDLDGVSIDVFYIYDNEYGIYCCDFPIGKDCPTYQIAMEKYGNITPRRLELPFKRDRVLTQFEHLRLYIPCNAFDLLECRYGSDYMIPKTDWGITSYDNHIVMWNDKKAYFIEY